MGDSIQDGEAMKEHPLLLSAPMVLAAIEGRKHVTRRILSKRNTIIDGKPWSKSKCKWNDLDFNSAELHYGDLLVDSLSLDDPHILTPIYRPGDVVWFKETWFQGYATVYRADHPDCGPSGDPCDKWKSSIFMPRWASRLVRPVIGSRIEYVQDITEEQAKTEGVAWFSTEGTETEKRFVAEKFPDGYRTNFMLLWDLLCPKPGLWWKDNPLVVAVEFGDAV